MNKVILLSLLGAAGLSAQAFSVGILGGAPFEDVVQKVTTSGIQFVPKTPNFVVGPSVRIGLPAHFRLEADALYRPYDFSQSGAVVAANVTASQWRFPLLLQYEIHTPVIKPFIEGGLSWDHLSNISTAAKNITSGPGTLVHQSNASVVLGGGVDIKIGFVRVSGELRWSHLGSADFQAISKVNQAEALVGLHF